MPTYRTPEPGAAEQERERKKREEERWKRILTWYVMQELEKAKQAERVKIEALAKLPEQSEPQAGAAPARLL